VCRGGGFRQLDVSVQQQKTACQRTQLQLMCYQWLYEDVLASAGHHLSAAPRVTLMTDLKKVWFALLWSQSDWMSAIYHPLSSFVFFLLPK